MGIFDIFKKKNQQDLQQEQQDLEQGIEKTKTSLLSKLTKAVVGKDKVDESVLDELENILIGSDVGVDTSLKIIKRIEQRVAKDKYVGTAELNAILRAEITDLLMGNDLTASGLIALPDNTPKPYVILVVGVNGVGKTTTIGKLSHQFKQAGKTVLLGAADTFRAAAVEQLSIWASRVGVPIVSQGMNADPSAVAYETLEKSISMGVDVVIIDTAGRLHNKVGLMNELTKIRRVIQKILPEAPHEVLLVLDATTGQNAFEQAKAFTEATQVNALAITKLDGTAKGGVVIGVSDQFQIPIKYIGVGEQMEQLQIFDKVRFVESLFDTKNR